MKNAYKKVLSTKQQFHTTRKTTATKKSTKSTSDYAKLLLRKGTANPHLMLKTIQKHQDCQYTFRN